MINKSLKLKTREPFKTLVEVAEVLERNQIREFRLFKTLEELCLYIDKCDGSWWDKFVAQLIECGIKISPGEVKDYNSENKILSMLGKLGICVIVTDREGDIVYLNEKAEEELVKGNKKIYGKKFTDFIYEPELVDKKNNIWQRVTIRYNVSRCRKNCLMMEVPLKKNNKEYGNIYLIEVKSLNSRNAADQEESVNIIGESFKFKQILNSARIVSQVDSTVLLRGESGTGKDLMAKYIHSISRRRNQLFTTINCAAIPSTLMECEMFGYVEGAFTGAKKGGKKGLLEVTNNGTVFLDEVAELSPLMQVKILRFLQEGTIRRIGDTCEKKLNIRIIAATNRDLEKMVGKGEFREDLYYRLNVFPIFVPPLRERKDDIPLLTKYFIEILSKKLQIDVHSISKEALLKLERYSWPGNIRELEHIIERAMILAKDGEIKEEDVIIDKPSRINSRKYILLYQEHGYTLKQIMEIAEKDLLIQALQEHRSIRKAASSLGLSHSAVLTKIKKLKIDHW